MMHVIFNEIHTPFFKMFVYKKMAFKTFRNHKIVSKLIKFWPERKMEQNTGESANLIAYSKTET